MRNRVEGVLGWGTPAEALFEASGEDARLNQRESSNLF